MPMKPKRLTLTLSNSDRDGICAAQQTAGAASLLLNGAEISGGVATLNAPCAIALYSGGNLSAKNFTLTGTDQWGRSQTETMAGPNAGLVVSTKYYKTITAIAVDAAIASDVEVGRSVATSAAAYALAVDGYENVTAIAVDISGTINYDVQKCYERMTAGETPNWVAGGLTGQTADGTTAYTSPVAGVRILVNSYSNGATIALNVNQGRSH